MAAYCSEKFSSCYETVLSNHWWNLQIIFGRELHYLDYNSGALPLDHKQELGTLLHKAHVLLLWTIPHEQGNVVFLQLCNTYNVKIITVHTLATWNSHTNCFCGQKWKIMASSGVCVCACKAHLIFLQGLLVCPPFPEPWKCCPSWCWSLRELVPELLSTKIPKV